MPAIIRIYTAIPINTNRIMLVTASLTIPSSEAMIATEKMIRATAEETMME